MGGPADAAKAVEAIVADKSWRLGRMDRPGTAYRGRACGQDNDGLQEQHYDAVRLAGRSCASCQERRLSCDRTARLFPGAIIFPVGSRAVLFLRLPEILWPRNDQKHRTVRVCAKSAKALRLVAPKGRVKRV
jgi:hypothetical protein